MRFMWENLRKVKESQAKHEVEVRDMETKTNKALEELRVDLVRLLPEEILDVLVQELMFFFKTKGEGEESSRSPDVEDAGQEGNYSSGQENMRHAEEDRHARMSQGWHNEAKHLYITVNLMH